MGTMIEILLDYFDPFVYLAVSTIRPLDFLHEIITITPNGSLYDFILELTAIGNRGIFGQLTAADLRRCTEGLVECAGDIEASGDETFLRVSAFWVGNLFGGTGVG